MWVLTGLEIWTFLNEFLACELVDEVALSSSCDAHDQDHLLVSLDRNHGGLCMLRVYCVFRGGGMRIVLESSLL